jgi:hypothetical protein
MEFRNKSGIIPPENFDREVPVRKKPNEGYSKEFVEAQKIRLEKLRAARDAGRMHEDQCPSK